MCVLLFNILRTHLFNARARKLSVRRIATIAQLMLFILTACTLLYA